MLRDMNDDGGDMDADVDADVDWRTADFEPGDVVALSADVVHMSASNESGSGWAREGCEGTAELRHAVAAEVGEDGPEDQGVAA